MIKNLIYAVACLAFLSLSACQNAGTSILEEVAAEAQNNKPNEAQQKEREEQLEKRKNGTFNVTHTNKTTSTFTLVDGVKQGPATQNFPDGTVWKEVTYKNDKLDGLTKIYTTKGKLDRTVEYKNGKKNGWYKEYFKSGNEKLALQYKDDLPLPGLKRVNYLGEDIPTPAASHTVSKKAFGDTVLFTVEYALNENFKNVDFYALPPELKWSEASEAEIRKNGLPKRKNAGFIQLPVAKGYYFKINHDLLVRFDLPNGRRAAIVQRMDYLLQN
jgi:hypothetical protein